jgi:hypothetical protein
MLWLDVFLGWFLLWVLLLFLLVRVTVDIFGIRAPGGEAGWLPSFRDCSGRLWVLCAKRHGNGGRRTGRLHDGGVISVATLQGGIDRRPDLPGGGRADTECCSGDVGRAQAGEPSGLSLVSAAG